MDLSKYDIETLLLSAIKSEVESRDTYSQWVTAVSDVFIKDRLMFLANEEDEHRKFLEDVYRERFPGKDIALPESTPVPLPYIKPLTKESSVDEVLDSAIAAEVASRDYYLSFRHKVGDEDTDLALLLEYLAKIEDGHYVLLKILKREPWRSKFLVFSPVK